MDISDATKQEVAAATVTDSTNNTKNQFSDEFVNALNIVVKKCLSKMNYSFFKQYYPELVLEDPDFLKESHNQLWCQFESMVKDDFDKFLLEQNIYEKLNELNLLIKSNTTDEKKSWRPSGDPNEDIIDHRCRSKLKHLEKLQNMLRRFQEANEKLEHTLEKNHEEILTIKKRTFDLDQKNRTKLKALTDNLTMMEELLPVVEESEK